VAYISVIKTEILINKYLLSRRQIVVISLELISTPIGRRGYYFT